MHGVLNYTGCSGQPANCCQRAQPTAAVRRRLNRPIYRGTIAIRIPGSTKGLGQIIQRHLATEQKKGNGH